MLQPKNVALPMQGAYEKLASAIRARDLTFVCRPGGIPYVRMMESVHWTDITDFGGTTLAEHLLRYPQILDAAARREGLGKEWTVGFLTARRVPVPQKKSEVPLIGPGTNVRMRWDTVPGSLDVALRRSVGKGIETLPLWQADPKHLCVIKKRPPP